MTETVTAFYEDRRVAAGEREDVARAIVDRYPGALHGAIRVFDDASGRAVDLDYRPVAAPMPPSRGRPRLGVTAREVTLLPRHWDWLASQPGGASAALRRLVEEARRSGGSERQRRDAVYHVMHALCGDKHGYEEALRALYRGDRQGLATRIAAWPEDIRRYLDNLLDGEGAAA